MPLTEYRTEDGGRLASCDLHLAPVPEDGVWDGRVCPDFVVGVNCRKQEV